uniref:PP2C family protein-serine/threonine phosphatase n=1 Tax=Desertihabitans aurantiacus TaxID=2282477 RepID=UPI0018E52AB3
MTLRLSYVAHSEVGLVRKNNQDSGYASPTMLVVADGMGGAAAGDLASAVAIAEVQDADAELRAAAHAEQQEAAADDAPEADGSAPEAPVEAADEPIEAAEITLEPPQMLDVLAGIVERANQRIAELVAADPSLEGMGTTVDALMFDGTDLALAHIGDSRAYLLRDGVLTRLTHDHSWVQSLIDEGRISLEEAAYHPHRSLLLKVLNGQPSNDPDLSTHRMQAGDRLLLCSDGLCGLVEDDVLGSLLAEPDPATALERLVSEAHAEGGIDNITIIIADLLEAGEDDELPDVMVLGAAGTLDIPEVTAVPPRAALPPGAEDDGTSPPPPLAGGGSPASASTPVRPQGSPDEREEE